MFGNFRIGLALGGGAARALSHIGIIEGLEECGIRVDVVTGTSMGAIIAAMYARNRDIAEVKERISRYLQSDAYRESRFDFMRNKDMVEGEGIFFKVSRIARRSLFYTRSVASASFVPDEIAERNYAFLIDDINIEELQIPFAASSLDLLSGEEVILDRGSLRKAIAATCAIPGILRPVEQEGCLLVDGGWINPVPVDPARRLGADFVIAVDISPEIASFQPPVNALSTLLRANTVTRFGLACEQLDRADTVLVPAIGHVHWADFTQAAESINSGWDELQAHADELLSRIRRKRLRRLFGLDPRPPRPTGGDHCLPRSAPA